MANPEHLEILKQGIEQWNQWRDKHPGIHPDFSEADLSGAELRRANLDMANFCEANLSKADLGGAKLFMTVFIDANLSEANLGDARLVDTGFFRTNLTGVNFQGADFSNVYLNGDLSGLNFRGVNFRKVSLSGANLAKAIIGYTIFADVDLNQAQGLETVRHLGPSEISISTIYRSQGNIPESFLRGAGVPEPFIVNMKSLVAAMSPIDFYSCFLSYSSKDQEFAERIYADLQAKGVRCWYAPEDLKIGDRFRQRIDDAIRLHDKLLVVLSETSVASSWVKTEVEAALERERKVKGEVVLFPIRLDEAVMETDQAWAADIRRQRHMGDFSRWQDHNAYQKSFQRLLRDLQGAKTGEARHPEKSTGQGIEKYHIEEHEKHSYWSKVMPLTHGYLTVFGEMNHWLKWDMRQSAFLLAWNASGAGRPHSTRPSQRNAKDGYPSPKGG